MPPRHSLRPTAVALTLALLALGARASAQTRPLSAGDELGDARAFNVSQDGPQAYTLLGEGAASLITGGVLAITDAGGERVRFAGVNMLGWGLINGLIATRWALGTERERREIGPDRALTGERLEARRRELIARSESQSRSFAVNAALDVLYIAAGATLWYVFDHQPNPMSTVNNFWVGTGAAMLSQGAFLFVFDIVGWCNANERTSRLERTRAPLAGP